MWPGSPGGAGGAGRGRPQAAGRGSGVYAGPRTQGRTWLSPARPLPATLRSAGSPGGAGALRVEGGGEGTRPGGRRLPEPGLEDLGSSITGTSWLCFGGRVCQYRPVPSLPRPALPRDGG